MEPGAQVRTDGFAAYRSRRELGYGHERTVMLGSETCSRGNGPSPVSDGQILPYN